MKRIFWLQIIGFIFIGFAFDVAAIETVELESPGNAVLLQLAVDASSGGAQGKPVYSVKYLDKQIIQNSALGLLLNNDIDLTQDFEIIDVKKTKNDEIWTQVVGKAATARNHYNEALIRLKTKSEPEYLLNLYFRAYDDGAAIRYEIPEQTSIKDFAITREITAFDLANDNTAWFLPLNRYTTNYEMNYRTAPISEIPKQTIIGLPITFEEAEGVAFAITEASLTDYAGMYLSPDETAPQKLNCSLSPRRDDKSVKVKGSTPFKSPWRVIMLGKTPGDLIESEIVQNLNAPCAIEDTDWIKPGLTAWDWWAKRIVKDVDFEGGMNTATMMHYTDFAAEMGWEFMLIDAEWYGDHRDANADITTSIPEIDLPKIIAHAKSKNVDILLWLNWRNVDKQMEVAFPLYEKWGVKGVKIDYMDRDDQEMVQFYNRTVKLAAKYHLMVDFHGAYKPTGIRRTWPNLMTREGVMGLEHSRWSENVTPDHDVTLPFTRMLAGPMDYTPGGFRNSFKEDFKVTQEPGTQGTRCHQLAMYVVYESPMQMCVDYPGAYRGQPGIEFLRYVPASWDESLVLDGKIGDFITMARRSGQEWYIGSMTDWDARQLKISLDFLGKGKYAAQIFADDPENASSAKFVEETVKKGDELILDLASGGGCAVRLVPFQN